MSPDDLNTDDLNTEEQIEAALRGAINQFTPPPGLKQTIRENVFRQATSQEGLSPQGDKPQAKTQGIPLRIKFKERNFIMKQVKRIAVAAIVVIGLVGVFSLLMGRNNGSGVVFGDVISRIEKVQSMSLDANLTVPGKPNREYHNDVSGAKYRKTSSNGTIQIANGIQGKMISLNSKDKTAFIRSFKPEGNRPIDFLLNLIGEWREEKTEDLGEKTLDGKKVVGFRTQKIDGAQRKRQTDVWVDTTSGWPVLIEMLYPEQGARLIMKNFVWNPDLDEKLFDMTPPPGYTVTDKTK